MSEKQKSAVDTLTEATQAVGLAMMTSAVTLGLVYVPEHDRRAVLPMHASLTPAVENVTSYGGDNQVRRERDEVHPHYISYGINQRTPARSGRI